jgi:glycosyltransferase involved in cell wall biosynthesis
MSHDRNHDQTQEQETFDVALLCTRFWPDRHGGVESRMLQTAQELAKLHLRVLVVTENRCAAAELERLEPRIVVRRVSPLNAGKLWRWRDTLMVNWWRSAIARFVPAGTPIWASEPLSAVGALLAGRASDTVFNPACCSHGMQQTFERYPHIDTMRQKKQILWLDALAYKFSRKVVLSSHNLRLQFQQAWGTRPSIHIVPHGSPTALPVISRSVAREKLNLPQDAFIAGFVGRLDPCKDLGHFLTASRAALAPNDRILIVGQGPDRARIENLAQAAGVHDRLVFTGRLDEPAIAYAAMDVKVLTSVYEAFGNVLMEAMGMGVPLIGRSSDQRTTRTACDEIIHHGKTGLIVDAQDPASLTAALRKLKADRPLLARMSQAAREHARVHTWQRTCETYVDLIHDIDARLAPSPHPCPAAAA